MVRKTQSTRKRPSKPSRSRQAKIAAARAALSQLSARTPQAEQLITLLNSWLADDSGYDEATWPQIQEALDQERKRSGARRLFHA